MAVSVTLLPNSDFGIRGWDGNQYQVNAVCAHPKCGRLAAHKHHMWSRSYLRGQPQNWVRLGDGTIIGNLIGLCVEHHEMVTGEIGGYRSKLLWVAGLMYWCDLDSAMSSDAGNVWTMVGTVDPQPPVAGVDAFDTPAGATKHPDHEHLPDDTVCPVCGHHKVSQEPRPKQPRRKAKEWTLHVPDDAEIGADILDTMIEDFAIPIGAAEWTSRLKRYHVLVAVLAWATVHRSEFIAEMAEAAERRLAG